MSPSLARRGGYAASSWRCGPWWPTGPAGSKRVSKRPESVPPGGWVWIDVIAGEADLPELLELAAPTGLDLLAVRDAVLDVDMPKADDFGDHLLVVLHSLSKGAISTYEVDCFLTRTRLITIHAVASDTDRRAVGAGPVTRRPRPAARRRTARRAGRPDDAFAAGRARSVRRPRRGAQRQVAQRRPDACSRI